MNTRLERNRFALPPPAGTVVRRAKIVLTALALVASVVLVAVSSWPLKLLVALVFVRGLFASDVVSFRNASRHRDWAPSTPTSSA